jgi:tRNA G37 N-methylase TrmD
MKVIIYFNDTGECLGSARKSDDYVLQGREELFAEDSSTLPDRESQHKQSYLDAQKAQEYARKREAEFPSIPDQLDEIYHNGIDSWKAVIKVTKDKYPKS